MGVFKKKKKKSRHVWGGVDPLKCGPQKKEGEWGGGQKRDRFRTVIYDALRPSRLLVVPTLFRVVGLGSKAFF